ncbi:hypothetical protein DYB28_009434 [Aphanomyces astaci]|uniref:Uncharacterized protein n=1 Tax=Aphanomyces astaci TaxID=112090 RepID=A0A9X8E6C5_APHAT|nr:hypothetical protein DYB28_009434 [Aphanomyces astaci]
MAHGATCTDDHVRAIEFFSMAMSIRPNHARYFLARYYYYCQKLSETTSLCSGNSLRAINEHESAIHDFDMAIDLDSTCASYYATRGTCHRKVRCTYERENAIKQFTAAVNLQDTIPAYLNNRGQALFRKGHESFRAALIDFNAAVKLDGKDAQAYYNRGLARLAIAFLDIEKRDDVEFAAAAKELAVDVGDSDDEAKPTSPSSRAFKPAPSKPPTLVSQPIPPSKDKSDGGDDHEYNADNSSTTTGIMSIDEQLDAAIADLDMACSLEPANTRYLYGKAMVVHLTHRHDELDGATDTLAVLQAALDVASRYHRGLLYHQQKDYERAIEELTAVIAQVPNESRFLEARGLVFQDIHLHDLAIEHCIDVNKRTAVFRLHRAQCYMDTTQFEAAHGDLKVALRLAPNDPRLLYFAGLALFQLKSYHESLAKLTLALKYTPPESYLCDLYVLAIADFTQVILHNPTNAHAHFRRAFAYKGVGLLQESAADIETAKLLDPTNPQLMVNYKALHDTECIILCAPGHEVEY